MIDNRVIMADSRNGLRGIQIEEWTTELYQLRPNMSDYKFKFVDRINSTHIITSAMDSGNAGGSENTLILVHISEFTATRLPAIQVRHQWYSLQIINTVIIMRSNIIITMNNKK